MTKPSISPKVRYEQIVSAMLNNSAVTYGSGKKGFGSSALQVNGKIFAMLSNTGKFIVKLPRERVDSLVTARSGERFDPGHGRIMREWLQLEITSNEDWLALAAEAMNFVASKR
jgi:hypothetical protein